VLIKKTHEQLKLSKPMSLFPPSQEPQAKPASWQDFWRSHDFSSPRKQKWALRQPKPAVFAVQNGGKYSCARIIPIFEYSKPKAIFFLCHNLAVLYAISPLNHRANN
jgi:hypothetical protein